MTTPATERGRARGADGRSCHARSTSQVKLIPSFWRGEFGRAWITPEGLRAPWRQFAMTSAPYVLDGLSLAVGLVVLPGKLSARALLLGLAFMLLCLRPAFDLACETVAFALGGRGDLHHLALAIGSPAVRAIMAGLLAFTLLTIARVLVKRASRSERGA